MDLSGVLGRALVTGADWKDLTWSSSDAQIVTVSKLGLIQGVSPGMAYVTCTDGERSAQCCVTVVEQLEDCILSGPRDIDMRLWEKRPLSYTYTGSGTLAYTTNNPQIAVVENGVLVAKKTGQVFISCTDGVRTATAAVHIRGWWE